MSQIVPLDAKLHKNFSINPQGSFNFAQNDQLCPLVLTELPRVVFQTPIVFSKRHENQIGIFALQGLLPGTNLILDEAKKWSLPYVPARYRCYPFCLLKKENSDETENLIVCFDDSLGVVGEHTEKNSVRLFAENGEPTDHLKKVISFLQEMHRAELQTIAGLKVLSDLELLTDWRINLTSEDSTKEIKGLLKIDLRKVSSLSDKNFLLLRKKNLIPTVYEHIFSLRTINNLSKGVVDNNSDQINPSDSLRDRALKKQKNTEKDELNSLVKNLLLDD